MATDNYSLSKNPGARVILFTLFFLIPPLFSSIWTSAYYERWDQHPFQEWLPTLNLYVLVIGAVLSTISFLYVLLRLFRWLKTYRR